MDKKTRNKSKLAKKNSLEKHISSIKHELRNTLVVIQEGASQALDGLGDSDCQKCYKILNPVLKSSKELDKLIEQLLNASKFESMLRKYKSNIKVTKDDLEIFKKELIGVISHVVRTPLTVIKEGLALILDEIPGKLNPKQKEIITNIKENIDRLINYIEMILKSSCDETIKTIGGKVHYKAIMPPHL